MKRNLDVLAVSKDRRVGGYAVKCPACNGSGRQMGHPWWQPDEESVENNEIDCKVCHGHGYVTPLCAKCCEAIVSVDGKPFCHCCNDWPERDGEQEKGK